MRRCFLANNLGPPKSPIVLSAWKFWFCHSALSKMPKYVERGDIESLWSNTGTGSQFNHIQIHGFSGKILDIQSLELPKWSETIFHRFRLGRDAVVTMPWGIRKRCQLGNTAIMVKLIEVGNLVCKISWSWWSMQFSWNPSETSVKNGGLSISKVILYLLARWGPVLISISQSRNV